MAIQLGLLKGFNEEENQAVIVAHAVSGPGRDLRAHKPRGQLLS